MANNSEDAFLKFCGGIPLWNESNLHDSDWPDLTPCFENTVLVWIPCGWLWITLPFYLFYLCHNGKLKPKIPVSPLSLSKFTISALLGVMCIIETLQTVTKCVCEKGSDPCDCEDVSNDVLLARILKPITFFIAAALTQIERINGVVSSVVLFVFWLLWALGGVIPFFTKVLDKENETELFRFVIFYIYYFFVLVEVVLHAFAEKERVTSNFGGDKNPCPEGSASVLNRLYFWWMNRIVLKAYKKTLHGDDLWSLNPKDQSKNLLPEFEKKWSKEQDDSRVEIDFQKSSGRGYYKDLTSPVSEKTPLLESLSSTNSGSEVSSHHGNGRFYRVPSLLKVLCRTYGLTFICSLFFKFLSDILQFASPIFLSVLIDFAETEDNPEWVGYLAAAGLFLCTIFQSVFYHQNFQLGMTVGMRIKSALISTIYKKALTMSNEARKGFTLGEIVNLMAVDCQRIQDTFTYLWSIMSVPVQTAIGILLLWQILGPSCLAGLCVLILLVPVNSYVAVKQRKLQGEVLRWKGARTKLMNEVLNGMKVLKMYAWEIPFQEKVLAIRKHELNKLMKIAYLQGFSTFCWLLAPFIVTLATFTTFLLMSKSHYLTAKKAFVALALFNILRLPINLLSQTISVAVQAHVSIQRIRDFLSGTDIDTSNVQNNFAAEYAIDIERGTFTWERSISQATLREINLRVPEGHLVAVVGQVGSGKSSLISAMLGEMQKLQGKVTLKGTVAYVPQEAWIQNATLMDNILFGKTLLQKKYKKVIDACALGPDLDILPGRDLIEIGEKGINISGGQKQRVSLARAVYSNSDIYLMDDPLSAVDAHVGKHIFNKVIGPKGLLKNKTRILVTHGVHWLPMVDTVVVMVNGRISEFGSYEDLMSHDGPFAQFLKTYLTLEFESDINDPELLSIRDKMLEKVESVTSDGMTSDDQLLNQKRLERRASRRYSGLGNSFSYEKKKTQMGQRLIKDEESEEGEVKWKVFWIYAKAMGLLSTLIVLIVFTAYHATSIFANFWLTFWTEDPLMKNRSEILTPEYIQRSHYYLQFYGILGGVQGVLVCIYALLVSVKMVHAAGKLHKKMLRSVMRAPMAFFDTTPIGRIINRFSSDIDIMDNTLPLTFRITINSLYLAFSTVIVISINTPVVLAVILPVVVLYYFIMKFYLPTSRQLKRLESVTRSPVFNHFSETVTGASIIRAYGVGDRFIVESMKRLDSNLVYYYANFSAARWLGVRLEFLSNCLVLAAAIFGIVSNLNGAMIGLSISYALQATSVLNILVVNMSDLQNNIVAVERVKEYSETEQEPPWRLPHKKPVKEWPQTGNVKFLDFKTRYRPGLDLVLRGISADIRHNEKIGIVGRTGAGKSSLMLSLFRLAEKAGGSILIDGLRICDIGLHDLREKITILPQDPVLFSGSLRMNLDPFDKYTDDEIWQAIERAHLKEFVLTLPTQLDYQCGEGGENLSVGQRQLVCLARTLLKKTKILILDEATAAVDMQTDDLIQQTIHSEFDDCTVLSIAHRLNTILDYDRVMVLDKGLIKEFDNPEVLLNDSTSIFYGMAKDAGLVNGGSNGNHSNNSNNGGDNGYGGNVNIQLTELEISSELDEAKPAVTVHTGEVEGGPEDIHQSTQSLGQGQSIDGNNGDGRVIAVHSEGVKGSQNNQQGTESLVQGQGIDGDTGPVNVDSDISRNVSDGNNGHSSEAYFDAHEHVVSSDSPSMSSIENNAKEVD